MIYEIPIAIHQQDNSAYGVTVPDIPGCFSAGDTLDEALENTYEAIHGHLELLAEDGITAPSANTLEHYKNKLIIAMRFGPLWILT